MKARTRRRARSDNARRMRKHVFREGGRSVLDFERFIDVDPADDGWYEVRIDPPGKGYRHVLTEEDVRQRLAILPKRLLSNLALVYMPRMTKKRERINLYGLQWGCVIYLYPMDENLCYDHAKPLRPAERIEAERHGGQIITHKDGSQSVQWTEASIRDYYLNNILIHELGHTHDHKHTKVADRERFAEEFVIRWGLRVDKRAVACSNRKREQRTKNASNLTGGKRQRPAHLRRADGCGHPGIVPVAESGSPGKPAHDAIEPRRV